MGLLSAAHAAAAPFAIQLGDARVALDAPPGFADTTFTGSPRLQELAEALTSASNKILLFAISDADLRRFTSGDPLEFRRYMIVVTPKVMERDRVSFNTFDQYVSDSLLDLGRLPAPNVEYPAHLDSQPRGKASLLAELRRDPGVVSVLQGARLPSPRREEKPQYLLSTTTLMLVRGKALTVSVYTMYDSPADVDWIRAATARWIEELRRLNSR